MRHKGIRECLKRQVGRGFRVFSALSAHGAGHQKGRAVVMFFQHKAAAEQFVTPGVRGVTEFGEDLEVRLFHGYGRGGARGVLEQKHVANPRAGGGPEGALAECGPQIQGAAHRLLGSVVEVVAEGRADLGLGLEGGDQAALGHDEEIPFRHAVEV